VDEREPRRIRPQCETLAGVLVADDRDGTARRASAEHRSPREERTEDDVRQLGLLRHEAAECAGADAMRAAAVRNPRDQDRRLPGQEAELTEELVRTDTDDDLLRPAVAPGRADGGLALVDEHKVVGGVSRAE
jgi:hypothetical protein